MSTGYVWHELYGWHDTSTFAGLVPASTTAQPYQHFESAESKTRFASIVEVSGLSEHLTRIAPKPASEVDILRVHTVEHMERIRQQSLLPKGGDAGDGESPFGQGGFDIAMLAAGGAIAAARAVMNGEVRNAYALIRPPGHHARPTHGMGFCIFSNASVAIRNIRADFGVDRIAVVDWDVHHGNGTQEGFYDDPSTLTISIHQDGLYPLNSGPMADRGVGLAEGSVLNVPLPAGSGNGAYVEAVQRIVGPALRRFKPELIVVPSGFDASAADPLGRQMVTSTGYREMTKLLMEIADDLCDGRIVMTHEGGYSPVYVPYCGLVVLETMADFKTHIDDPLASGWDELPGQECTEHQRAVIESVMDLHGI